MMIHLLFLSLFFSFQSLDASVTNVFCGYDVTELSMKSKLSKGGERLLIELDIPQDDAISFELYDRDENILHRWDMQQLAQGEHQLSLPLPSLKKATYIVKLVGEKYELKHLLFVR